jgi:hypothetical protein
MSRPEGRKGKEEEQQQEEKEKEKEKEKRKRKRRSKRRTGLCIANFSRCRWGIVSIFFSIETSPSSTATAKYFIEEFCRQRSAHQDTCTHTNTVIKGGNYGEF